MRPCAALSALALLAQPAVAGARPLTVRNGETWAFTVERGQPARAHRISASAKPAAGEIKVSVTALMGTTMMLSNNSRIRYTFRAELIGAPATRNAAQRTCTLPPNRVPTLEYWPVKASAVRLSDFKAARGSGSCP